MELHQLQYFITIVECGNFTKAAKKLHLTQPALSRQIKLLEEELRLKLLERTSKGVYLTVAGQLLLEHARNITEEITRAKFSIKHQVNETTTVKICSLTNLHNSFIDVITKYHTKYPSTRFKIQQEPQLGKVLKKLKEGEYDLIYTDKEIEDDQCESSLLFSDPLVLIASKESDFVEMRKVDFEKLSKYSFIISDVTCQNKVKQCLAFNFQPNVLSEVNDINTLKALVAKGLGISIIPRSYLNEDDHKLLKIELDHSDLVQNINIVWLKKKNLLNPTQLFVDYVQNWFNQRRLLRV